MIKYRYHSSDPEPPPRVTRVQTVHEAVEEYGWGPYLGDTWVRVSCRLKSGGFVYGRPNRLRIGRSHRSIPKRQWRRERDFNRTLCRPEDHIHWWNGDRHREWGRFRGHVGDIIDLDAFKRMRTMYRRKH